VIHTSDYPFHSFSTIYLALIFVQLNYAGTPKIKQRVIAQYLQGVSRDTIAADNGIGTGTVSNIIDEWKKRMQDSDYESIRELSVF